MAAIILDYFVALYKSKLRNNPKAPHDSYDLWIDYTQEDLADKYHCSVQTIARHIKILAKLRFITVHQISGYNRKYHYELHVKTIKSVHQSMPLFEDCQPIKMIGSNQSKCRDATYQNDRFEPDNLIGTYIPPSLLNSLPPSAGDDVEKDEEKEKLIDEYRRYRISKEKTEYLLTVHHRQKMRAALECLSHEARNKTIPSPAGFLVEFLKRPWDYGYEMDKNGCFVRSASLVPQKQQVQPYTAVVEKPKMKWDDKASVWQSMTTESRRDMIDKLPIPPQQQDFVRSRIMKWLRVDLELSDPPTPVVRILEEVL